jgi:hypothetical protein
MEISFVFSSKQISSQKDYLLECFGNLTRLKKVIFFNKMTQVKNYLRI